MKKYLLIGLLFLILAAAWAEKFQKFTVNTTLMVFNPEETQEKILLWLSDNRGYYLVRSDQYLAFRFPAEKVADFNKLLESLGEDILEINQSSENLQEQILAAKSGIKSREEILANILELFDKADVKGTLEIEKEVTLLINEIERLKGQLNKLETERTYAYGDINFSFKTSSMPENVPSSFGWLNSLDLYSFKQEGF